MYKYRINRQSPKITPNSHPQFFIRRSEFAFDPRVAYVESVCASLAESRFGPGCVLPVTVNWSDRLENEPAVFFDLLDDGATVSYWDAQLCGRCTKFPGTQNTAGSGFSTGRVLPGQKPSVNERAVLRPPLSPNQGRGSP